MMNKILGAEGDSVVHLNIIYLNMVIFHLSKFTSTQTDDWSVSELSSLTDYCLSCKSCDPGYIMVPQILVSFSSLLYWVSLAILILELSIEYGLCFL